MKKREKLIKRASTEEVDGEGWRVRQEEWMDELKQVEAERIAAGLPIRHRNRKRKK